MLEVAVGRHLWQDLRWTCWVSLRTVWNSQIQMPDTNLNLREKYTQKKRLWGVIIKLLHIYWSEDRWDLKFVRNVACCVGRGQTFCSFLSLTHTAHKLSLLQFLWTDAHSAISLCQHRLSQMPISNKNIHVILLSNLHQERLWICMYYRNLSFFQQCQCKEELKRIRKNALTFPCRTVPPFQVNVKLFDSSI